MLLYSNIKLYKGFGLAYLQLALTNSKGQGHAHVDDKYLGKGTCEEKILPPLNSESLATFDMCHRMIPLRMS